eukprot:1161707-Pelagomonas_calceolata.AAC.6
MAATDCINNMSNRPAMLLSKYELLQPKKVYMAATDCISDMSAPGHAANGGCIGNTKHKQVLRSMDSLAGLLQDPTAQRVLPNFLLGLASAGPSIACPHPTQSRDAGRVGMKLGVGFRVCIRRAKQYLPFFQRNGKMQGLVEFVLSGHRLKGLVEFVLSGHRLKVNSQTELVRPPLDEWMRGIRSMQWGFNLASLKASPDMEPVLSAGPADIFKGWLMVLNVLSSPLKHPCCLGPLLSTGLDPPKEGSLSLPLLGLSTCDVSNHLKRAGHQPPVTIPKEGAMSVSTPSDIELDEATLACVQVTIPKEGVTIPKEGAMSVSTPSGIELDEATLACVQVTIPKEGVTIMFAPSGIELDEATLAYVQVTIPKEGVTLVSAFSGIELDEATLACVQ